MTRVTADMVEPEATQPSPRLHLPRLSRRASGLTLTATRAAFLFLCALAATLAPEAWVRAAAALPIMLAAYSAGWFDGRRDLAADLLGTIGGRRDDRGPRLTEREGGGAESD